MSHNRLHGYLSAKSRSVGGRAALHGVQGTLDHRGIQPPDADEFSSLLVVAGRDLHDRHLCGCLSMLSR